MEGEENPMKLNKIIIRHLPPTMTEEEFLKQIDPLPENDDYYYALPDWSLGLEATCRAYITVKNYDDILLFRDRFDGYVFVDSRGNEYPAIVEFAPFQGSLKTRCRGDDFKVNTIESETHYQEFLKKMEVERQTLAKGGEGKLEFNLERKKEVIVSTPLLQYLANRKEKRREEARRRTNEKKQHRQHKSYGNQGDGRNRRDYAAIGGNSKGNDNRNGATGYVEREDNRNQTQSKRRNDRRAERNRRRSEEFKKRLQEQHMKQQQQRQQQQNNGNTNDNNEQGEQNIDRNGNPHNRYDKENYMEKERKESMATYSDDYQLNSKSDGVITTSNELNDSVRNFIYQVTQNIASAINSKNIPPIKQAENLHMYNVDAINYYQTIEGQHGQKDGQGRKEIGVNRDSKAAIPINIDNGSNNHNRQKQQDRRDEKRIRNKDRPSIAIYQPKARLRISEENDNGTTAGKETCSQSTSDCENVLTTKDEQKEQQLPPKQQQQQQQSFKHKRVQRYSERTKNRQKNQNKAEASLPDE